MKHVIEAGFKEYNKPQFAWTLNNICQYRCSYCYALPILKKRWEKKYENVYKTILKRLSLKTVPQFDINIVGGEPTLHPQFNYIVKYLDELDKCISVDVTTNLVRSTQVLRELAKTTTKLYIGASYHPEYDKNHTFAKKCIDLSNSEYTKFGANINLVKDPTHWPATIKTIETLIDNGVRISLNYLNSVDGTYVAEYSDSFYETFAKYLDKGDEDIVVPYVMEENGTNRVENIPKHEIYKQDLYKFKGYYCTPMMWDIGVDGHIANTCTNETLNILSTNLTSRKMCTVDCGCKCDNMYDYYKNKNE